MPQEPIEKRLTDFLWKWLEDHDYPHVFDDVEVVTLADDTLTFLESEW